MVNVAVYSVLVGGLPAMPQEEIDQDDIEAAVGLANTKKLDWQLEFATKYFDACVPNPPGYSSSVAAITILPSAAHLANAWGKWYAAASQLRRLRFIREVIHEKIGYDINDDFDEEDEDDDHDDDEEDKEERDEESGNDVYNDLQENGANLNASNAPDSKVAISMRRRRQIDREIFRECTENQDYYRSVLGVDQGSGLISYDFDPEQTAMYSREFAQGASSCCPNGCFEGRVKRATIDELREMESDALENVHAANISLDKAQFRAIRARQVLIGDSKKQPASKAQNGAYSGGVEVEETKVEEDEEERFEQEDDKGQESNLEDGFDLCGTLNGHMRKQGMTVRGKAPLDTESHHWALYERIMHEHQHNSLRGSKRVKDTVDHLVRESTYAVVTFMSRQAAVAARQCLADGRGQNRWITSAEVPVPPLADAAPCNICFCRGCCRPVSLSLNRRQKTVRKYV